MEFSGVAFGYSPLEPPLIEDLSISIRPGGWVALAGPSGSGKSTVTRLAAGLCRPWAGEVRIDGTALDSIPVSIRNLSVAIVGQDPVIFEGTIRENITLWDPTISEKDFIQAAKDAEIHDTISSLPGGYDHRLSDGGRNLSGGQRQRLEIARALAINPSILVMDEATSALDPDTEERILTNISRRGSSCLIIAHRMSTIRDCDEILVLQQGKVVERGTHRQLMNRKGAYYRLITAETPGAAQGVTRGDT
jgi:ABC-type bacteriocin/lantibiotic exporter with double-glycine peptidase domain